MRRPFHTFIGVHLGGGKGKTTAVARINLSQGVARVVDVGTKSTLNGVRPYYDDVLCQYLTRHSEDAILAVDAPLTAPACVRCRLPKCKTLDACDDPTIVWFREEGNRITGPAKPGRKPATTPYTQRACEVVLHKQHRLLPREALGQGMGPLTARAAYLKRALEDWFEPGTNLIEVSPKVTLSLLFGKSARRYKRHPDTWSTRAAFLEKISEDLRFEIWREGTLSNDHCFDALICAYTAYLWARDGWEMPEQHRSVFQADGWIWFPPTNRK